jgi:processive 1,2-diacylglycerol beta-glucosyltransferase
MSDTVLFLTAKFGMGHYSAAQSLAEQVSPLAQAQVVDLVEYSFPSLSKAIYNISQFFVSRFPRVYSRFYARSMQKSKRVTFPGSRHLTRSLQRLLEETDPAAVVCTFSLTAAIAGDYKSQTGCTIPLITCITDVSLHPNWVNDHTDAYLVASPALRRELISRGVSESRVFVQGIPVRAEFMRPGMRRREPFKRLLVMGGGLGMLPLEESFYQRLNDLPGLHTTVVTGRNKALFERLQGRYPNVEVLGYCRNISSLMRRSDLLFSKPGGVTTFEAIYSRLPLCCSRPLLEQEKHNAMFIEREGLGFVQWDSRDTVEMIASLLSDEPRLAACRRRMGALRASLRRYSLLELLEPLFCGKVSA